jgi:hypothetical protein
MKNTSLSGLLRGVQSRHDDCGISWGAHKIPNSKPIHIVKWGSPPFQYRNPRIDGPVVGQDDMEQRKEWLDTIARESERLGLD